MIAQMKTIPQPTTKVVRVAVSNNFNCTPTEYEQLKGLQARYPTYEFFVNCNIKTPQLLTLNKHDYKIVVTLNPNIKILPSLIERLYKLRKELISFVRVKYIPNRPEIKELINKLSQEEYEVVITNQKFNGKETLFKFGGKLEDYMWSHNRYRLHGAAIKELIQYAHTTPHVHICDEKGIGCQGCMLCSTLTTGQKLPLASLNLSTSGICKYNCPDCYAKTMQKMSLSFGHTPIIFDRIKANSKQTGRSKHIKENKLKMKETT